MASEDADQQAEVKEEEESICDACTRSLPVQSWCYHCAQPLCQECCQAHNAIKLFAEHVVVPLGEVTEEEKRRFQSKEKCEKHKKELEFYCLQCDLPACSKCVIVLHDGHRKVEMEAVLEDKRKEVQSWCQKVETALPAFKDREASSHAKLQRLKTTLENRVQQVETLFSKIVSKVNVRQERVLGDLRAQFEGQSQELETQHHRDHSAVESAQTLLDEGRAVASLGLPSQLIGQPKKMAEEFEKLQTPEEAAVEPLCDLKVNEGEVEALLTCLEKVGEIVAMPVQNDREARERSILEKYKLKPGWSALCTGCGHLCAQFHKCESCHRVLPSDVICYHEGMKVFGTLRQTMLSSTSSQEPSSASRPRQGPAEAAPFAPSMSNHASTSAHRTPAPSATVGSGLAQANSLGPQPECSQSSLPQPCNSLPLMSPSGPPPLTPRGLFKRPWGDLENGGSHKRSCRRESAEPESIRLSSDEDEAGSPKASAASPSRVDDSAFVSPMRTDSASSQRMKSSSGQHQGTSAESSGARDAEDFLPEHSSSQTSNSSRDRACVGKKSKRSSRGEGEEEEEEEEKEEEAEEAEDLERRYSQQPRDILVKPRKVRVGSLRTVPTTPIVFADTRIKFNVKIAAPPSEESEELTFEVFPWELLAVETSFEHSRPRISLKTTPECGERLKESLNSLHNHASEDLKTQHIVLVLEDGTVTAQVIQYFNKIDSRLLSHVID